MRYKNAKWAIFSGMRHTFTKTKTVNSTWKHHHSCLLFLATYSLPQFNLADVFCFSIEKKISNHVRRRYTIRHKSTDSTRCELGRGGAHNACGSPRRVPLRARVVGAQLAGAIQPTNNHRKPTTNSTNNQPGVTEILMKKMWRKRES